MSNRKGRTMGMIEILRKEWDVNYRFNPLMERYCRKVGIHAGNEYIPREWMEACKSYCEKQGVWFKNEAERTMFYDIISVDDDEDNDIYTVYVGELLELRKWCKQKGHTWKNFKYEECTAIYLGRDTNPMARRINTKAWEKVADSVKRGAVLDCVWSDLGHDWKKIDF